MGKNFLVVISGWMCTHKIQFRVLRISPKKLDEGKWSFINFLPYLSYLYLWNHCTFHSLWWICDESFWAGQTSPKETSSEMAGRAFCCCCLYAMMMCSNLKHHPNLAKIWQKTKKISPLGIYENLGFEHYTSSTISSLVCMLI